MALIKRKQIDLYIKSATGNVPDNVFGIDNLAGIAAGAYALSAGDQYEIVVDKIVGAIDTLGDVVDGLYYTYLVDGAGSKNLTKQATIDLKSTANQVSVSKNDLTNGVEYTFSLPATIITPGSIKVTTTTELVGNVTLSGNSQTITHTGTGNLTISSTNGEVYIEGSRFNGNNATVPGDLTVQGNFNVVGNVTQTAVNDVVVQDRFIKLANGNTGSVSVTGLYQQTGSSSYSGLIYNATEGQFRLFTSTVEPTTSSAMSILTPANLKIYGLDANNVEFISLGNNAKEAIQDLMHATLTEGYGVNLAYTDAGTAGTGTISIAVDINEIAAAFNLQVKTYEDSNTPNQYGINLLSESLVFSDSDTALVKKVPSVEALKVIIRGTIHEDVVYNVAGGPGKFNIDGSGNAVITLSYNIATDEFEDIMQAKEYVQVFINGVKCRYFECEWTAGAVTVKVYAGSNTSGSYVGVGFPLESTDVFTVLYYGDKTNSVLDPTVTTTTTVAPTTTTTTSPVTTAPSLYETYGVAGVEGGIGAVDAIGDVIIVGDNLGVVWVGNGESWTAGSLIPGSSPIECVNMAYQLYPIACSADGITYSTNGGFGWEVLGSLEFTPKSVAFDGTTIFVGASNGTIYKTTNFGAEWSTVVTMSASPVYDIAVERTAANSSFMIAVSGTKVYYSANSGSTWDTAHTATNLESEVFKRATINTVAGRIVGVVSADTIVNTSVDMAVAPQTWVQGSITGTALSIQDIGLRSDGLVIVVDGTTDTYKIDAANIALGGSHPVVLDESLSHSANALGIDGSIAIAAGQTSISIRV
jgi:hypothetical protein